MAAKTKPEPQPARKSDEPTDGDMQIVVRRGALRRYDLMKRKSADLPVKVTWDRRAVDRRTSAAGAGDERRSKERRKAPPFTWELADFVIVERPEDEAARLAASADKEKAPKKTKTERR